MLNQHQYDQLLKPLNPSRVAKRSQAGRSLSYLEAWDVKAHLNRIFGFTNWSADVFSAELAYEDQNEKGQWQVGYKVIMCLRVNGATYTEAAVGSASLPQRGEAHDMAVKTAESDALKRAAINLGTQFGLSLYDNGSLKDVVHMTLDRSAPAPEEAAEAVSTAPDTLPDSDGAAVWIEEMKSAIAEKDIATLLDIKKRMAEEDVLTWVFQGITLAKWLDRAIAAGGKA